MFNVHHIWPTIEYRILNESAISGTKYWHITCYYILLSLYEYTINNYTHRPVLFHAFIRIITLNCSWIMIIFYFYLFSLRSIIYSNLNVFCEFKLVLAAPGAHTLCIESSLFFFLFRKNIISIFALLGHANKWCMQFWQIDGTWVNEFCVLLNIEKCVNFSHWMGYEIWDVVVK